MDIKLQIKHVQSKIKEMDKITDHDEIFQKTQEAVWELEKILDFIRPERIEPIKAITSDNPWDD